MAVKVKPGSRVDQFTIDTAGQLTVKLKAPAQDGRANAYLIERLARELHIPKSAITIMAGSTSPHKRLEIDVPAEQYQQFLARIVR